MVIVVAAWPPNAVTVSPSATTAARSLASLRAGTGCQVPAEASKRSAVSVVAPAGEPAVAAARPPSTTTLPSESRTASCPARPRASGRRGDQPRVPGSNSSTAASEPLPSRAPPTTSTRPSRSFVAVCPLRASASGATAVQRLALGS